MRRELARTRTTGTTAKLLVDDVAAGIRVLQTRDGVMLSDDQIVERARNIVAGLIGNYRIHALDAQEKQDKRERREPSRGARTVDQLDLLDAVEKRAEARQNGRPVRA